MQAFGITAHWCRCHFAQPVSSAAYAPVHPNWPVDYSYDHMDIGTIKQLDALYPNCKFYVPLGNKKWFSLTNKVDSAGNDRVHELDWWDHVHIVKDKTQEQIRLTCTPAQHQSGRTPFDKDKTLWSSWSVEALDKEGNATNGKVFFGG